MKKTLLIALALSLSAPVAMAKTLATVNGKAITEQQLNQALQAAHIDNPSTQVRQDLLQELIQHELMLQEAERRNLHKQANVQRKIEDSRKNILLDTLIGTWLQDNPVKDSEIKTFYDKNIKNAEQRHEYRVRHILVKDQAQAQSLRQAIIKGDQQFADVAKAHSLDPGSAQNGGELDWAPHNRYVPEFAQAVAEGALNQLSEPVQTQFGFHLIEVLGKRPLPVPSLEQSHSDINRILINQKFMNYIDNLRKKAKIVIPKS